MSIVFKKIASTGLPSRAKGVKEAPYKKLEPFHCKGCNRAWQPLRDYTGIADYLIGFPKFGCTPRKCINCKRKEKNNGTIKEN